MLPAENSSSRSPQQRSKRSKAQQASRQGRPAGHDRADVHKSMRSPGRPLPAQQPSMPCSSEMGSDLHKPNAPAHHQAAVAGAARQGVSDPMQGLPAGSESDAITSNAIAAGARPKPSGLQRPSASKSAQTPPRPSSGGSLLQAAPDGPTINSLLEELLQSSSASNSPASTLLPSVSDAGPSESTAESCRTTKADQVGHDLAESSE